MIQVVASLALAAVLVAAAGLKLTHPRQSAAAMEVYGAHGAAAQWLLWGAAIAAEVGLAVGVALGSDLAAYLAAALMASFAVAMSVAIAAGRSGRACACFGPRSRLSGRAVARNAVLAAGFLALPFLPEGELTSEQWVGLGLALALVWIAGMTVALLALAREVGELQLRMGPAADSALEIPEEGPPVGEPVAFGDGSLAAAMGADARSDLLLAAFFSEGCHICRSLEPQVRAFVRDPVLAARIYDEVTDSEAWQAFAVPGSPYAVACDLDGTALAKGSFNTVAQLESILATAERRRSAFRAAFPGG